MNTMRNWAKKEVKLAIDQEDTNDIMGKYYERCYKSALKAFEILNDDGYLGTTWGIQWQF